MKLDYRDFFKRVENAVAIYTSELDHSAGGTPPEVMIQDRLSNLWQEERPLAAAHIHGGTDRLFSAVNPQFFKPHGSRHARRRG
jgi:hypothetical protein